MSLYTAIEAYEPIRHIWQGTPNEADAITHVWRDRPVNMAAFSVITDVRLTSGPNGLICSQRSARLDGEEWLYKGFDLLRSGDLMWRCYEDHLTPHGRSLTVSNGRTLVIASFNLTETEMTSRLWTPSGNDAYTWETSIALSGWQAAEGTPLVVGFGMLGNGNVSELCDDPVIEFAVVDEVLTTAQMEDLAEAGGF